MTDHPETKGTIQGRLDVLRKQLVSEQNSVQYYLTLLEKTNEDSEENIGARRIYQDLHEEEKKHVKFFEEQIKFWEQKLEEASE